MESLGEKEKRVSPILSKESASPKSAKREGGAKENSFRREQPVIRKKNKSGVGGRINSAAPQRMRGVSVEEGKGESFLPPTDGRERGKNAPEGKPGIREKG